MRLSLTNNDGLVLEVWFLSDKDYTPAQAKTAIETKLAVFDNKDDLDAHDRIVHDGSFVEDLKPGDKLIDFRGDEHKFKSIVKRPGNGSSGKIATDLGIFYPGVFNLTFRS